MGAPAWAQVAAQPVVVADAPTSCDRLPSFLPAPLPYSECGAITVAGVRSTTRSHGAPQTLQQPRADVPARMHGSTSAGGNVAKCAPL